MAEPMLLPPLLAGDERMRTLEQLSARISATDLSPLLINLVDQVGNDVLPLLAEQFHMQGDEGWLLAADDMQRRQLIKRAIEWHRYKGTRWALEEIFRVLGISVELLEWWQQQPPAEVHTFQLVAWANDNCVDGQPVLSAELYRRLQRMVDHTKPVRSSYALQVGARHDQTFDLASAGRTYSLRRDAATCRATPFPTSSQPAQLTGASSVRAVLRLTLEGTR